MSSVLDGCTALITGASAGIGREFARQLAPRVGGLVLVARRLERLEVLHDEIQARQPALKILLRVVDLSDPSQVDALCEWLRSEKIEIDVLINNAGLGDMGPFATGSEARLNEMIFVNIVALTKLTYRLLPPMVARRKGVILNVSSSAAYVPIPGFAVYAASKAYVNSFSEALRAELRGTGVRVTALCPGPVATEFSDVARRPRLKARQGPAFVFVPVEEVVREAIEGVETDTPVVIPGVIMKIVMALARLTPMPLLRFASRFYER